MWMEWIARRWETFRPCLLMCNKMIFSSRLWLLESVWSLQQSLNFKALMMIRSEESKRLLRNWDLTSVKIPKLVVLLSRVFLEEKERELQSVLSSSLIPNSSSWMSLPQVSTLSLQHLSWKLWETWLWQAELSSQLSISQTPISSRCLTA